MEGPMKFLRTAEQRRTDEEAELQERQRRDEEEKREQAERWNAEINLVRHAIQNARAKGKRFLELSSQRYQRFEVFLSIVTGVANEGGVEYITPVIRTTGGFGPVSSDGTLLLTLLPAEPLAKAA